MKTFVYSIHGFDKPFIEKEAKGKQELFYTEQHLNSETAHLAKGCEAVALFTSDNASCEVLEKLYANGVRFIALRSVGHEHVDIPKANELGMKVANVPTYSPYAIAEYAVAMILILNRKFLKGQELNRKNNFLLDTLVGFDLYGKTIGIVGTGKIGTAFAKILYGFGCKLIGYDIKENGQLIHDTHIQYVPLNELCEKSDIVSINCPLTIETKYMFNKSIFSKMKKGSILINTARGGIVNTIDLLEALDNGTIAAAGLDVYEYEKPIFFCDHEGNTINDELFQNLRSRSNVLLTGHQAFLTAEALEGIASTTIANLNEWEKLGSCSNELK
ncbi:MAG: 2-hydroxyacid dehydrogenase [Bacteroidetes bacterium]|nr:2-hydroxyacid dehydrogenase [Bacteroidota bacterium]